MNSLPAHQRGASVPGMIALIVLIGIVVRVAFAIVPDYIDNYQVNRLIARELTMANEAKMTGNQFLQQLSRQLSVNGNSQFKPSESLVFTSSTTGALAVRVQYSSEQPLYKNTYIVNRFNKEIQ